MAITVANLVAQVGADLTQFRIGMNEVEARLKHVDLRGKHTNQVVQRMQKSAEMYRNQASANLAKAAQIDFTSIRDKITQAGSGLQDAIDKVNKARDKVTNALSTGVQKDIQAADKALNKAIKDAEKYSNILERANKSLETARNRKQSLISAAQRQLFTASGLDERAQAYDEEGRAGREVARAYAQRLAQNAFEHRIRAFNAIGGQATAAGTIGAVAFAGLAKVGSDLDETFQRAYHNTTLTTEGLDVMRKTVRKLAGESGADINELTEGFRKIENYTQDASASSKILEVAMKSAVSAGSDLGTTGELLASTMKTFRIPVEQAAQTMDQLHIAANLSSLELRQLVDNAAPAYAAASRMGVSFTETNAALVLFTRYLQGDAPRAVTQWVNVLQKIGNPTKQVKIALANLREESRKAGVDLQRDFTQAGLRAKGFANIVKDIEKVAKVKGVVPEDLMSKLIPNLRGTAGASIAVQHIDEYRDIYKQLVDSTTQASVTDAQYRKSLQLTNVELRKLKNELVFFANDVAKVLAPSIKDATEFMRGLFKSFNGLDAETQKSIIAITAAGTAMLIFVGITSKLVVGLASVQTALQTFGVIAQGQGFMSLLTKIPIATGPVLAALGAVAGALLLLKKIWDDTAPPAEKNLKQISDEAEAQRQSAAAKLKNANEAQKLIEQMQNMNLTFPPVREEMEKLKDIYNKLSVVAPELVTSYSSVGNAMSIVGNAAELARKKVEGLTFELRRATALKEATNSSGYAENRAKLSNELRLLKMASSMGSVFYGDASKADAEELEILKSSLIKNKMDPVMNLGGYFKSNFTREEQSTQAARMRYLQGAIVQQESLRKQSDARIKQALKGPILPEITRDPFTKKYTTPGPDLLADIYDKEKKARAERVKKDKKSEEEKLRERALAYLENIQQATYLLDAEGKLADATWQTTTAFKDETDAMKQRILTAAKDFDTKQNQIKSEQLIAEALRERIKLGMEALNASKEDIIAYELTADAFKNMTAEEKKRYANLKLQIMQEKERVEVLKTLAKVQEMVMEPLQKEMSPFGEMLNKLTRDKDAAKALGFFGILGASAGYATNVASAEAAKAAEDAKKKREKEAADAKEHKDKVMADFNTSLDDARKAAYNDVIGIKDPEQMKWLDFYDKMTDKVREVIDLNSDEGRTIKQKVAETWEYVRARQKEVLISERIRDINQAVARELRELGDMFMINYRSLQITKEEWANLSKEEQKAVRRLVEIGKIRDVVVNLMQGLEEVFFRSLNNIRENGFKSFFRDIVNMFEDMLFELAARWLASFFVNQIMGLLGNIFGGGGGNSGGGGGLLPSGVGGGVPPSSIGLPGAAMGGPATYGRAMVVGERGWEVFVPKQNGRVVPQSQLAGVGGNGNVIVNMTVVTNDASSFKRSDGQISARIGSAIERARKRNG